MRRLALTHRSAAGAPLARDVVGRNGEVLARAGHLLSERVVRALQQRGVANVFVDDPASDGIPLTSITPGPTAATLQELLGELTSRLQATVEPLANQPTPKIVEALRAGTSPVASVRVTALLAELRAGATSLARACAAADGSSGYLTDRQPDDDLVGHSIQVAALTARIGAAVGLADDDLVGATYAALLHDLGFIFVPVEIRGAPDRWSMPQRMRYEDHAVLGEALLASIARSHPIVPVVAVEHHEAQDGSGYPRTLQGGNRVFRVADRQRESQLSLVSEVVAVADRYERLVSPAPARAGLSPAEARYALSSEAGAKLNSEVVARFLDTFPALPLGTEVRVVGGEHDGAHAIVKRPSRDARSRPLVRVYADRSGAARKPVEVDLDSCPDVSVLLDEGRAA
ncbi:MAG: HD domain-containing protein [Dehalococcoidia bacterium]|nr:MAG: HD domain-containing protein [Dehalococcoidia bacterium]